MIGDALILRKKDKDLDANEALKILVAEGEIEPSEITFNKERPEYVPTIEELHQVLVGVSVPIEEIIREEREKQDDILHRTRSEPSESLMDRSLGCLCRLSQVVG